MANEEQLAILMQGIDVWNQWMKENPEVKIDFKEAYLGGYDFTRADFRQADFSRTNLRLSNFSEATLVGCNFADANLRGSNLKRAHFNQTNFTGADLRRADLFETNFSKSVFGFTVWGNNDLSKALNLETVAHAASSVIGTNTIQRSKGKIPVVFLRGCGLSDLDIEYAKLANPELTAQEVSEITQKIFDLKDTRPIQISPLFISYSHANSAFVERIETKLHTSGIRFWRDVHDATAGRLETQIDRAIRHNPTVLLILSENSTKSDWVEHEVRLARKLEIKLGRDVLCPIALDDSWKTSPWPERIMEQITEYNILDFSKWNDDIEFDKMFTKLIDGLDMFYKG